MEEIILSPYDPDYPIKLLSDSLNLNLDKAKETTDKAVQLVSKIAPLLSNAANATAKTTAYIANIDQATIASIKSGATQLVTDKTGKIYAQLRNANGQFGQKFDISEQIIGNGLNPTDISTAIQMYAIQQQLEEVLVQLNNVDKNVKSVLQGQQSDRMGLYYSGVELYMEAESIQDMTLKALLYSQAQKALSDAYFQLVLPLEEDIRYLAEEEYKKAKGKTVQLIDEKMSNINKTFVIIHQAALMKAAIYAKNKEIKAMCTVLNEYSGFIEKVISKNAVMLSQCDRTDSGTEKGVWHTREHLKLQLSNIIGQLDLPEKTILIDVNEEA